MYDVDGIPVRVLRGLLGPSNFGLGTLSWQLHGTIANIIEQADADIVHAHGLLPSGTLAVGHAYPSIVTAHGSEAYRLPNDRSSLRKLAQDTVRSASALTAVSSFVARHLKALGAEHVDVMFNGADDTVFAPRDRAAARSRFALPITRPVVAYAGHLMREKGVIELVEAIARLGERSPVLLLAGSGPLEDTIRTMSRAGGTDVRLLGHLAQHDIAEMFAAADIVSLPSYAEGLPTVLCEALMMGRAIVASDVGGISEIVPSGERGWLVPPRDANALTNALAHALDDHALRRAYEARARAFAAEHLTWATNAASYETLYTRVLEKEKRQRDSRRVTARSFGVPRLREDDR